MKLHFFQYRKPNTKLNEKEQPPSVQSSNSSCGENSTNQSLVSTWDNTKNGWFLFRIIRQVRSKNHHKKSPKTGSRVSSSPTTSTSTTKNDDNATTALIKQYDTPVSFIRIKPKDMDDSSRRELLQKFTSTNLMKKHGLDRDDSIISYFKQVDDAYNEMVIVVDHGEHPTTTNYNCDDETENDEEFYNEQNAIDQSISLITMDPALVYRHSVVIDEYSWKSFVSLSEHDEYVDNEYNDDHNEHNDAAVTPIRYFHI